VAEAEALAAERDQVLEEIARAFLGRGLEDQAHCCRKRRRSWPIWTGGCRRRSRPSARGGACRELTSEVERLSAAGEALEALESLVRRSP